MLSLRNYHSIQWKHIAAACWWDNKPDFICMRRKVHLSSLLPQCPRLLPSPWCGQHPSSHTGSIFHCSPSPSSPPPFPPFSLGLLLTRPWWKLLTGQGSIEQCGEVIVHTAFPLPFSLSLSLSLSLSTVILNTQPNIAGETRCPLFLNLHSRRVTIFPDTRVVKMRKTWPFFHGPRCVTGRGDMGRKMWWPADCKTVLQSVNRRVT